MSEKEPDAPLVWIDLEMTGLDITKHVIVEIACIVTTSELEPIDDGLDIVVHAGDEELAYMDDFVRTMHTKSALLDAMAASTIDLAAAGAQTMEYLTARVPLARSAPVCGNSIGV